MGSTFLLLLLVSVESLELSALVLEHLIELLSPRLHILVILVNQQRSEDESVEAMQVISASVLFLLLNGSLCSAAVNRAGTIFSLILKLLVVVEQRFTSLR